MDTGKKTEVGITGIQGPVETGIRGHPVQSIKDMTGKRATVAVKVTITMPIWWATSESVSGSR